MNINESANFSCDITQEEKSNHSLTFKLILIGTAGKNIFKFIYKFFIFRSW